MIGVSLGAFCPPLGVSTISIGLPAIASSFHQPVTSTEWVIVTYTLVITALLMTFGRLGDLVSTKRLYVIGFGVFTLGALTSGLSPGFGWLLASRAVQGLGGAMMFSVAAAIVTRAFPPSERGLALGIKDRKSTRLNSSHSQISYAVFCLKKKTTLTRTSLG